MRKVARVFLNGRSQAVRLPAEFRFDTVQVYIRKDAETGDVILSSRPDSWDDFFMMLDKADIPEDFLSDRDTSPPQHRDLFHGDAK